MKISLTDKATSAEIYYGIENLLNMGEKITETSKLAQILQTKLKSDDSLLRWVSFVEIAIFIRTFLFSFGYTFLAASRLGASGQYAYDRIEDIIVQADEIDGKMLQFEGGLGKI